MTQPATPFPIAPSTFTNPYLAKQAGNVTQLPIPDSGPTVTFTRGATLHALASGGATITRRSGAKRVFTFTWTGQTTDNLQAAMLFFFGARDAGPFVLAHPGFRNQMGTPQSSMNRPLGTLATPTWAAAASDTQSTIDTGFSTPNNGSYVTRWNTPVNNHFLVEGTQAAGPLYIPDPSNGCIYLNDQGYVLSLYARSYSSTASVQLTAMLVSQTGTLAGSLAGPTISLNTAGWQRLTLAVPSGTAGFVNGVGYFVGALKCVQAGCPDIAVCEASTEIGVSSAAASWAIGMGMPRVLIPDPLQQAYPLWHRRTTTITMVEV